MKTIYTILFTLILSTSSLSAQIEGMLGDILKEVQDKVGDAQQTSEKEADSKAAKELKDQIKFYISGINDLDKYSAELKCVYLMLKLAFIQFGLETDNRNEEICQKQYDLYGMQLMVLASTSAIGYCYEDLDNLKYYSNNLSPEYENLLEEYYNAIYYPGYSDDDIINQSALELDFRRTLMNGITTMASFYREKGDTKKSIEKREINNIISYIIREFNPLSSLFKIKDIGLKMKALPCSDGRT